MAITVRTLYDGQLTTTPKTILYTVPTLKAAIVSNIRLVNTDTVSRTANIYYLKLGNPTTAARLILPANLTLAAGVLAVADEELTMGAGDKIVGDASAASKVDVVISGIERDA